MAQGMRYERLCVMRDQFGCKFEFGGGPNLCVMRGYALCEVCLMRGSSVWTITEMILLAWHRLSHPFNPLHRACSRTSSSISSVRNLWLTGISGLNSFSKVGYRHQSSIEALTVNPFTSWEGRMNLVGHGMRKFNFKLKFLPDVIKPGTWLIEYSRSCTTRWFAWAQVHVEFQLRHPVFQVM